MEVRRIERALLSVSDKAGLTEFAAGLIELGVEIISTGGTAKALREAGLTVRDVSAITGVPEMLDGRVKTLHPLIHGGILARRDLSNHLSQCRDLKIGLIDLVVVNLYPFATTIAKPDVTLKEAVEQIDIGGPAMLRSAAKNHASVTVICNPARYTGVMQELRAHDGITLPETRRALAVEAFAHTATYDGAIAAYLATAKLEESGESDDSAPDDPFERHGVSRT